MNVLVVGGGSMGRRRLRDLTHLRPGKVVLFEPDAKRCAEVSEKFGVKGFTRFEEALEQKPSAMSISTPPALHEQYVRAAVVNKIPVFSELPFVLDKTAMAAIAQQAERNGVLLGISGTIRLYPPFSLIRKLLGERRIGKHLYAEYSLGNHIADWHPYEDYRKFYASDVRLGGAGMDMILHELAPIIWWLGPIASVGARLSKVSNLEINGPDTHDVLLTFASGCRGFFHHDIIERGTVGRHVRIVGEDGTIEWHQNQSAIRVFDQSKQKEEQVPFEQAPDWNEAQQASDEMRGILARQAARSGAIPGGSSGGYTYESNYLREMKHFLEAAEGKREYALATVEEELRTIRTFHAIVESDKQHRETPVEQ
jgi:predicted dehydrogenase